MRKQKALVAMSGGVDSSVAAALLVKEGYDVTGVMLKLWTGEAANNDSGCCNLGAAEDARRVADTLGIRFYVLNYAERFDATVVRDFQRSYSSGRTPNPCVRCNQWIKFGALMEKAEALGAEVLATGHYARVRTIGRRHALLRGVDRTKDQSYVLWMLTQDDLARTRFPVGDIEKQETRRIAADLGLRTARKPDSQEICFVRGGDLDAYVDEHLGNGRRGPIVDPNGTVVGEHRGLAHYTVGQRKGLGLSLGVPVFVTRIDAGSNTLSIGKRSDLAVAGVKLEETSFSGEVRAGDRVLVQHRAHGEVTEGRIDGLEHGSLEVSFARPVEAVAPGQSAALYAPDDPDVLLGGGIIQSTTTARREADRPATGAVAVTA